MPDHPAGARQPWARTTVVVTMFTVIAITTITAAISYDHEYQLARRHGQTAWVSSLLPFTVDGMILGASVVLVWASSVGIRRPVRPLLVLMAGISATIGANLAAGLGDGWLGAAVSAWSGLALILISDVAMWLTGALRRLAAGESPEPVAACSCPPPPVSLAEAVAGARDELRRRGEPAGEQVLADRFGVNRYRIRTVLGESGPPDVAGTRPLCHSSRPLPAVSVNGDGHAGES